MSCKSLVVWHGGGADCRDKSGKKIQRRQRQSSEKSTEKKQITEGTARSGDDRQGKDEESDADSEERRPEHTAPRRATATAEVARSGRRNERNRKKERQTSKK
jgi:hypothetical protein